MASETEKNMVKILKYITRHKIITRYIYNQAYILGLALMFGTPEHTYIPEYGMWENKQLASQYFQLYMCIVTLYICQIPLTLNVL